jgi:hypothetical protein
MGVYLAFQHTVPPLNTGAVQWNDVRSGASAQALVDESNAATGFTVTASTASGFVIGGNAQPTGSAAWVGEKDVWEGAHAVGQSSYGVQSYSINGLNDASTYDLEIFGSVTSTDRTLGANVNGGAEQTLFVSFNTTNTLIFAGISPVSGVITVNLRKLSGSNAYINASRISAAAADTTAPAFDTAPAVTATSETGHTIASTLNETGTIYGVRLASGATAPSAPQVVAGQNSAGTAALEAVSVAATAATNANLEFLNGAASTAYDYYIVAEDDEGNPNLQAAPTLVSETTAAAAVPGIGQITAQFEGVAVNVADWHIIVRLVEDQSILYNQTALSSDASGNIAAFATTSGNVGDPVRVEGHSAANGYSFVIKQNLGNIA